MPSPFKRHVAIGDPQSSFERFHRVLAHHRLLGPRGRLRDDVQLVSLGDHFDWGGRAARAEATRDGTRLLRWLASHPAEQAVILAGNHDLARVGELAPFDDAGFRRARARADRAYRDGEADERLEAALRADYPTLATAEVLARDLSCFEAAQRALVTRLLRAGRLLLAHEHRGLLLVHAGVTRRTLRQLGIAATSARGVAQALNRFLARRVRAWRRGALDLSPFHVPGDSAGEGGGALYHRAADPARFDPGSFRGPRPRRFDPRDLPRRFPQAIGHVRHGKAATLMPGWTVGPADGDGPIRTLAFEGDTPRYQAGLQPGALLYFLDGGMHHLEDLGRYELLDLDARAPLAL